jgi:hypothetical protein
MCRHDKTDRKTDRQCKSTGWQEDKETDVQIDKCSHIHTFSTKDRHTDRQTDRQDIQIRKENRPTDRRTASYECCVKKSGKKFAILKKFATRTPVSPTWTNRVPSKKHNVLPVLTTKFFFRISYPGD